jgi:Family of unknown function (DUF5681)
MSPRSSGGRKPTGDYAVGNCRPPVGSRFKPGQSGNPKGKKKGVTSLRADINEVLREMVPATMNGVTHFMTGQKAMVRAFLAMAIKGNFKAAEFLFSYGLIDQDAAVTLADMAAVVGDEEAMLAAYLRDAQIGDPSVDPPDEASSK